MRSHAGAVAFFGALAVVWTWPLVLNMSTAVPGGAGDNYSFLWTLWWMRRALDDAGTAFFHTTHLFFPFGSSLVNHSHYALPAFAGATVLGGAPIIVAQNLIVLAHVCLNGLAMFGLAWDVTRHYRASMLAGVLFGTSPYLASHVLGHFELLAAWPLPAFAWALRRAFLTQSKLAVAAASAVLIATAYTTYYYVVYLGIFAVTYFLAWTGWVSFTTGPRVLTSRTRAARAALIILMIATALLVVWIATTGGAVVRIGSIAASLTRTHNPLSMFWVCAIGLLLTWRRVMIRFDTASRRIVPSAAMLSTIAVVFLAGAAPLLVQAAALISSGQYVSQQYYWRSAPAGVDLLAPVLGHPFHPFVKDAARDLYTLAGTEIVESVAWMGAVPCVLLVLLRVDRTQRDEARRWWIVAAVFAVWALGPNLMVGGIDVGMPLPQTLARFIPIVSNARIPGRAMVVVYMAIALLIAMRMSAAAGWWARPQVQWALIAVLVAEFMAAPITLTRLTHPSPYRQLAAALPGGVCHVPFIMGDGLRTFGPYDLSVMYGVTQHEHPIAGGFLSRMPPNSDTRYAAMPIAGDLLALAGGHTVPAFQGSTAGTPCTYLVVDRSATPPATLDYLKTLPLTLLAAGDDVEVHVVGGNPP
jgi:hypothetical protein